MTAGLKFYSAKPKRQYPESRLQKAIVQHLLLSGAFFFSIPNERKSTAQDMARLKSLGLRAGVADLCIIVEGRAHFMEVKAPGGVKSEAQYDFLKDCNANNIEYACINNIDDALAILAYWGAIKPSRRIAA